MCKPIDKIRNPQTKARIIAQCGPDPIADGLTCDHCGCSETFKPRGEDPDKYSDKWFWMIKPFKVDMFSHCLNCDEWF